jgi:hypothetical protein
MKKSEILKLLESEDWTKADALRAISSIDLSTDPNELSIRRARWAILASLEQGD